MMRVPPATCRRRRQEAFTLLEMLVAMVIFLILMGVLLSVVSQSGSVWQRARDKVDSFQSARFAFDLVTKNLSQSTLNVYGGYDNPSKPTAFLRQSDLHFVIDPPPGTNFNQGNAVFFQAPIGRTLEPANYGGLPGLLSAAGYYVTYGKNPRLPDFLKAYDRPAFRLMQFLEPTETLSVYTSSNKTWFTGSLDTHSSVVANNVVLLLFWPRLSNEEDPTGDALTDNYTYDSRSPAAPTAQRITTHQQPPLVRVTMVALEETSARRLPDSATPPSEITSALSGLFAQTSETDYARDLAELERRLNAGRISYRVFDSTVPLRESKWSKP